MEAKEKLTFGALFAYPEHSICSAWLASFAYLWQAFDELGDFIRKTGAALPPDVYERRGEDVWIARDAEIAPTATLTGPLIVCPGAKIRPGAFIRGNVVVGAGAVVGNSTELKSCILFDGVEVPHFNYVGDSILGYRAHLGAGAVTSNIKSDRKNVVVHLGNETIETGRRKLGALLGDYAEVGCNSVLNPGTVIGRHATVYPLSSVRGYVPGGHIYKTAGNVVKKRDE